MLNESIEAARVLREPARGGLLSIEIDPSEAVIAPCFSRAVRGSSPRASQSEPGVGLCSRLHTGLPRRLGEAKRSSDRVLQLNPRVSVPGFWADRGTLHHLEGEIEQAVALWERARTMASLIGPDRIMLAHYYESAGRHEDAQAIVQEMLSAWPEMTAERGFEMLARFWNEEWIPEDLEAHLRSAGLP